MYYAQFDSQGNRITSYHTDVHDTIPEDAIEISDEEQNLYATNLYIRGVDGRPQLKPPHVPTDDEVQKMLTNMVQTYMDKKAKELGYDNLISAVTYADEPAVPKFQAEGIAFRKWRSEVWVYCYAALADVKNGIREIPSYDELIAELPPLTLAS